MNVHPSATDVRSSAMSVRPSAMNAVCAASLFKICCKVFFLVTEILYICEWKNAETDIMREVNPKDTSRAKAFELWMKAPNPMVTFFKTIDVTRLVRISQKKGLISAHGRLTTASSQTRISNRQIEIY